MHVSLGLQPGSTDWHTKTRRKTLGKKSANNQRRLQALICIPLKTAFQIVPVRDVTAQSRLGNGSVVSNGQGLPFRSLMTFYLIPAINTWWHSLSRVSKKVRFHYCNLYIWGQAQPLSNANILLLPDSSLQVQLRSTEYCIQADWCTQPHRSEINSKMEASGAPSHQASVTDEIILTAFPSFFNRFFL